MSSPVYAVHKWSLAIAVALWFIGIIATSLVTLGAAGGAFIVSGVAAIAGGRSFIGGIRLGGWGRSWTAQELAEMGPVRRFAHAALTGAVLILLGTTALGYVGRALRNDSQRRRHGQLEQARGVGTWRPNPKTFPQPFGAHDWFDALAVGGDTIYYSTSGIGLVSAQMHGSSGRDARWLDSRPVRRVSLAGHRLLFASDARVGAIRPSPELQLLDAWPTDGLPRAVTTTSLWVAWDAGSAVVSGVVDVEHTRRLDVGLRAEGRIVLAGLGEQLLVGPTADCPLKSVDLGSHEQTCILPAAKRPVASHSTGNQVALAFEDGELLTLTPTTSRRWGKLSAPLALTLVDSTLFVVTRDGVYRLRAPGAAPEPLFAQSLEECDAVGPFGDLLAWQVGSTLRVIRRDAKPLEPFELP